MSYVGPKIKSTICMFVLYPESQQKVIEYVQENFSCAWALHDKDVWLQSEADAWEQRNPDTPFPYEVGSQKKEHIHFVCTFPKSGRYFHAIANELGVPPNTIQRCNNLLKAYRYLAHLDSPDKYVYDESIIQTHDFVIPTESSGGNEEEEQVRVLLEMPAFDTTYEAARWAYEHRVWAAFRRGYAIWRDIRNETRGRNY